MKKPLVVEIYTRLMTGAVKKSSEAARTAYLAKKRKENALYAGLSRGVMAKAMGSEDAFDALVTAYGDGAASGGVCGVAADGG